MGALVPVDKLDVTVSKGWVTLKGEVEWQYQKMDAERVVCTKFALPSSSENTTRNFVGPCVRWMPSR